MLKALTYDAGFEARVPGSEFLVLVPYAPAGLTAAKSIVAAASGLSIKAVAGRRLRFEAVAVADLEVQLGARSVGAVLILTGTPLELAQQVAESSARRNRYAITLEPELVKAGATVGVALNGGKAQVILNVAAARTIKAEFSPAVMKVARLHQ